MKDNTFVILGNQLFDPHLLKEKGCEQYSWPKILAYVLMKKHHKLKIYLFLCAMREYKDELSKEDIRVHYQQLDIKINRMLGRY